VRPCHGQRDADVAGDVAGNLILYLQNVAQIARVGISPQMRLVGHLNELHIDAHVIFTAADAAFQHVLHVQDFAQLVDGLCGEQFRCCRSDYTELRRIDPAELRDSFFGEACDKFVLLGIAAAVRERPDEQACLVRCP
jgi:hypothetical protein